MWPWQSSFENWAMWTWKFGNVQVGNKKTQLDKVAKERNSNVHFLYDKVDLYQQNNY